MAIKKLLIANRGEIACRIIRSARALGIHTVAVYSQADANSLHVRAADESVPIGPASPAESYLSIDRICQAITDSGADAVHPGYGFLSENPKFAMQLNEQGTTFVGPSVNALEQMGNKAAAKHLMQTVGIPCVPGYTPDGLQGNQHGDVKFDLNYEEQPGQSEAAFIAAAAKIGYPIMIKAADGGGGRGIRLITEQSQFTDALALARAEALNAFASDKLILEKAITDARHVEVQIFADNFGHTIHLGERDCSIQRRHQKIIEEAPCNALSPGLRNRMGAAAVTAAKAVSYTGAGTVEFLLDGNGDFYFLEMNTRLQVEHPVTELITGLDLVAMQLQIASGEPLSLSQDDVRFDGHAIEVRLCAENPASNFMPTTGTIYQWNAPSGIGVRVDAGIEAGTEVTPWYDSMLAKIIVHGSTRSQALQRMSKALAETVLLGPASNQGFLYSTLFKRDVTEGTATTEFIADSWPDGYQSTTADSRIQAVAMALYCNNDLQATKLKTASAIHHTLLGWTTAVTHAVPLQLKTEHCTISARVLAHPGARIWQISININDDQNEPSTSNNLQNHRVKCISVECLKVENGKADVLIDDSRKRFYYAYNTGHKSSDQLWLAHGPNCWQFSRQTAANAASNTTDSGKISAPMPGMLIELLVTEGQSIAANQQLATIEAMKMQHQLHSESAGVVTRIHTSTNTQVRAGELLIELDTER